MPIDWGNVSWVYVGVLAVFAFFSTLVGSLLSFNHRGWEALLSALIFAAIFVLYSYYPHNLPLPNPLAPQKPVAAAPAPATPATPAQPAAPSPPRNPVTDVTPQR